jgi:hypothetical protein
VCSSSTSTSSASAIDVSFLHGRRFVVSSLLFLCLEVRLLLINKTETADKRLYVYQSEGGIMMTAIMMSEDERRRTS